MPAPPSPATPADAPDLQVLQRRRKHALRIAAVAGMALLAVTQSRWRTAQPALYDLLVRGGVLLILLCIAGRTWCTLYIGGHKKRELITKGPYSLVRNPLYVFTFMGTAGVGALSGSFVLTLAFAALALVVFSLVVRQEEVFLGGAFGRDYAAYAARVPRFWPRFSSWEEAGEVMVRPRLVRRTFLDASLFLLAVPLMELKDWGQATGRLPVLLYLP